MTDLIIFAITGLIVYLTYRVKNKIDYQPAPKQKRTCVEEFYTDGCWYIFYSDGTVETVSDERKRQ
jgi:hypothetical protein